MECLKLPAHSHEFLNMPELWGLKLCSKLEPAPVSRYPDLASWKRFGLQLQIRAFALGRLVFKCRNKGLWTRKMFGQVHKIFYLLKVSPSLLRIHKGLSQCLCFQLRSFLFSCRTKDKPIVCSAWQGYLGISHLIIFLSWAQVHLGPAYSLHMAHNSLVFCGL